ncbi:hypothetical protein CPC08DRAFT_729780 [Agrocybe pediades]|nr:hypothetical protein CPC08DRAFT_729780 [Agrocybe pediades]
MSALLPLNVLIEDSVHALQKLEALRSPLRKTILMVEVCTLDLERSQWTPIKVLFLVIRYYSLTTSMRICIDDNESHEFIAYLSIILTQTSFSDEVIVLGTAFTRWEMFTAICSSALVQGIVTELGLLSRSTNPGPVQLGVLQARVNLCQN